MRLHANAGERIVIDTAAAAWTPSPEQGVDRVLLERDGGEVARATSIVRYAPGARFKSHEHGRGEELLVLAGELRDEHGTYPAGYYLRNPWGTRHAPFSPLGCTLFVKLRQMRAHDRQVVVVQDAVARCVPIRAGMPCRLLLHHDQHESVSLVRWPPGHADARHRHARGEEILVLEGELADEHGRYGAGTWLRQPPDSEHQPFTQRGCLFWMKAGVARD